MYALRFSVQFATNALKRGMEGIPRSLSPLRFRISVNKETSSKAMKTKIANKRMKDASKLPAASPVKKRVRVHNAGCKKEERKTCLRLANDIVENTSKRSIRTAEKPRRKSLTQIVLFSIKILTRLPRKMKPNHVRQEKRERAEQRLKVKIGSFLRKLEQVMISDTETMQKKVAPKMEPKARPKKLVCKGKITRIPPIRHVTQSKATILMWDGRVNRDE